jgi:uncharacterized membrane protein YbhN (UPF0104 family)
MQSAGHQRAASSPLESAEDQVTNNPPGATQTLPGENPASTDGNRAPASSRIPHWYRRAEFIGLAVLVAVTAYGIYGATSGDWAAVTQFWRQKLTLLPLILGLAVLDVVLGGVSWVWILERFGIRARDRVGARVYVAERAGLLMPAQLGRLIRPDAMVRLERGTLADCGKAEAAVFVLDALSVVALLCGLVAWLIHPALGLVAGAIVILVSLYLGDLLAGRLAKTRFGMPAGFWWNPRSMAVVMVQMAGWAAHGVAFYFLVVGLPGNLNLWDALFYAPGSAVLGIGTGLPGGVGATEGFLGASLRLSHVPMAQLALVVAAFRVVTFWLWIPIGWVCLAGIRRRVAANGARAAAQRVAAEPVEVLPEVLRANVDAS